MISRANIVLAVVFIYVRVKNSDLLVKLSVATYGIAMIDMILAAGYYVVKCLEVVARQFELEVKAAGFGRSVQRRPQTAAPSVTGFDNSVQSRP